MTVLHYAEAENCSRIIISHDTSANQNSIPRFYGQGIFFSPRDMFWIVIWAKVVCQNCPPICQE